MALSLAVIVTVLSSLSYVPNVMILSSVCHILDFTVILPVGTTGVDVATGVSLVVVGAVDVATGVSLAVVGAVDVATGVSLAVVGAVGDATGVSLVVVGAVGDATGVVVDVLAVGLTVAVVFGVADVGISVTSTLGVGSDVSSTGGVTVSSGLGSGLTVAVGATVGSGDADAVDSRDGILVGVAVGAGAVVFAGSCVLSIVSIGVDVFTVAALFAFTVTLHLYFFPADFAVMTAVPLLMPFTRPLFLTVAIFFLFVLHLTDFFLLTSFSLILSPTLIVVLVLLSFGFLAADTCPGIDSPVTIIAADKVMAMILCCNFFIFPPFLRIDQCFVSHVMAFAKFVAFLFLVYTCITLFIFYRNPVSRRYTSVFPLPLTLRHN